MTAEFPKMFSVNGFDMCIICLDLQKNIKEILSEDEDGLIVENKLQFIIADKDLTLHYSKIQNFKGDKPKHICNDCLKELNNSYDFKSKCQRNLTFLSKFFDKKTENQKDVPAEVSTTTLLFDIPVEPSQPVKILIEDESCSGNETATKENSKFNEIKVKEESADVEDVEMENATVLVEILKPVEDVNIQKEPGSDPLSVETEAGTSNQIASIADSIQQLKREKCKLCFRSPSGKNYYRCGLCDDYFTDVRSVISHLRNHTEEKPCECNICNKQFTRKDHLVLHLERHRLQLTGERPYQCDVCEKCFIQADNLTKHKKSHLKKSHKCDVCNKSFKRYGELTMHKRIHNNVRPYACTFCKKTFVQKNHLINHERTHTNERPFPCSLCDYRAVHKSAVDLHVKRMHKKKTKENVLNVVPVQDVIRIHVVKTEADEDTYEIKERTEGEEKIEEITGV